MNVNEKILELETITGYPVCPDIYNGQEEKYITFVYEDEKPALFRDNHPVAETVYLQITLYSPANYNYFSDKEKIKKFLIKKGFILEAVSSFIGDGESGTNKVRHTIFYTNYTEGMEET